MTNDRHQRVKTLFLNAKELAPEERDAFLEKECAGDTDLRREVESLLAHEDDATVSFMQRPLLGSELREQVMSMAADAPPARIGAYRVISEVGRGGMGAVYLGVRDAEGFTQRVAIKVIKRGMDTDDIVRRFELERHLLAALDHPNIARLIDGGATEDGLPYFVLEYIDGKPIDDYCDEKRLSTADRLKLFRQVCEGVQCMHQNLIVHRDLKPSNILVTSAGVPKIVDFGIAKLLNPALSPILKDPTALDLRLLTPEYASPEQVRGENVTTSSDIYSLGVLLYELLTGRRPYRLRSRIQEEMERIICEQNPEKPSTAISKVETFEGEKAPSGATTKPITPESVSTTRASKPDRLRRQLAGDIDDIVLMAMRKEPDRRYATAEQLSEDIRRHLDGLPVMARPDSVVYRFGKFVRRNRTASFSAALIALSLTAGVIGTSWQAHEASMQRDRAERRFDQVRDLARVFMYDFHDEIAPLAGSTPARELLVTEALAYLSALEEDAQDDPALLEDIADAYDRVGDIQAGIRGGNLGNTQGAIESYRQAESVRAALQNAPGAPRPSDARLLRSHLRLGDVLARIGDDAAAADRYQSAVAAAERILQDDADDASLRRSLAVTQIKLADAHRRLGDLGAARQAYEESLGIRRILVDQAPTEIQPRRDLSVGLIAIADLEEQTGDHARARTNRREALRLREEILVETPESGRAQRDVGVASMYVARSERRLANFEAARAHAQRFDELTQALLEADPENARARRDRLLALDLRADVERDLGDVQAALDLYSEVERQADRMIAMDPENRTLKRQRAAAWSQHGDLLFDSGDVLGARAQFTRALESARTDYERNPESARSTRNLALAQQKVASARLASGDAQSARSDLVSAIALLDGLLEEDFEDALARSRRADALRLLAEVESELHGAGGAIPPLERAEKDLALLAGKNPDDASIAARRVRVVIAIAEALEAGGQSAEADARTAEALALYDAITPDELTPGARVELDADLAPYRPKEAPRP